MSRFVFFLASTSPRHVFLILWFAFSIFLHFYETFSFSLSSRIPSLLPVCLCVVLPISRCQLGTGGDQHKLNEFLCVTLAGCRSCVAWLRRYGINYYFLVYYQYKNWKKEYMSIRLKKMHNFGTWNNTYFIWRLL